MQAPKTIWNPGFLDFFDQHPCSLLVTSMRESAALIIQPSSDGQIEILSYDIEAAGGSTEYQGQLCISSHNGYYSFLRHQLGPLILHQVKRKTFYGPIQPHELHANSDTIWVGNTGFNCIAEVNETSSFKPYWHPPFINPDDSLGDRCHLNGFAICPQLLQPEYVTVFCRSNKQRGWRESAINEGCVYKISTNSVIHENLLRPHSPRVHNNKLYLLESGSGKLIAIDLDNHHSQVVYQTQGFVRGLHLIGNIAIIGVSAFRETFHNLPNANPDIKAGLVLVEIETGKETGRLEFEESMSEFFSVTALPSTLGISTRHTLDMGTGYYISIDHD